MMDRRDIIITALVEQLGGSATISQSAIARIHYGQIATQIGDDITKDGILLEVPSMAGAREKERRKGVNAEIAVLVFLVMATGFFLALFTT